MTLRVGLLGGTFDPIHFGHLRSAVEVREYLALDELRLVPNARPPHRDRPGASAQQRLEMVCLATASDAGLLVDDCELRRDRPSYTVDTLESLRADLGPAATLFLIVGWDAFSGLPSWNRWEELLQLASLVVLQRPEQDQELPEVLKDLLAARSVSGPNDLQATHGEILCLAQTPLAISATHIRSLIQAGRSPRFLLPDSVLGYIETNGLYQP
ncbi:nicotinic acid mononucleotide adenylyltransferase [Pseudomonas saudimassiliensis]|uniref:Probable nicotinate-nucleotide adenylyltransferase n=1 Tax=Pseudomonas saudimassiliensis TaxID=1461581 RepID=A0A078MIV8_9PSED|nr:nicotinate-nucleotide adenylyltransferase [Pseudomonas saudimassiliensis]CEA06174.1 nicotinic acid mononucleotide adenylyltransferase [Pseudomonas saudimassiliensis]CEF27599.1 nicotinic acid mononucleotide adenylyltransferase [Pseudomonas saudimassiliensis]